MRGEPVSNGMSALPHFFSRTKVIEYLRKKYITNLSLIFNIPIVHCTQTNQSIVNYFEGWRYQSFKTKKVDSKYEHNVSCSKVILKNRINNFLVETRFCQFSNMASSGLKKMFILQFYTHTKVYQKLFSL